MFANFFSILGFDFLCRSRSIRNVAEKYNAIKSKLDLKQFELNACSQRLALTVFQQNQQEIQDLESKIGKF